MQNRGLKPARIFYIRVISSVKFSSGTLSAIGALYHRKFNIFYLPEHLIITRKVLGGVKIKTNSLKMQNSLKPAQILYTRVMERVKLCPTDKEGRERGSCPSMSISRREGLVRARKSDKDFFRKFFLCAANRAAILEIVLMCRK